MARTLRLTPRFLARRTAARIASGSDEAKALGRTLAAIGRADVLPGPLDVVALMPPTGAALVRRVTSANLWVWFRVEDNAVAFVHLSRQPPTPLLDES